MIYKLLSAAEWAATERSGSYPGSAHDRRDGFIHFSGPDQVVETAALHFADQTGLVLLRVDPDRLGTGLRWETSRGGQAFPHLYAPMPHQAVVAAHPLPDGVAASEAVAALLG